MPGKLSMHAACVRGSLVRLILLAHPPSRSHEAHLARGEGNRSPALPDSPSITLAGLLRLRAVEADAGHVHRHQRGSS